MGDTSFYENMGTDALRVWMDFWELSGGMRVDILRKTADGGDPEKMIAPDIAVTTVASVCAIRIDREVDLRTDRSGDLVLKKYRLEMIDPVYDTDSLLIGGAEYQVQSATERNMGSFSVWVVEACR